MVQILHANYFTYCFPRLPEKKERKFSNRDHSHAATLVTLSRNNECFQRKSARMQKKRKPLIGVLSVYLSRVFRTDLLLSLVSPIPLLNPPLYHSRKSLTVPDPSTAGHFTKQYNRMKMLAYFEKIAVDDCILRFSFTFLPRRWARLFSIVAAFILQWWTDFFFLILRHISYRNILSFSCLPPWLLHIVRHLLTFLQVFVSLLQFFKMHFSIPLFTFEK